MPLTTSQSKGYRMHSTVRQFIVIGASVAAFTFAGGSAFAGYIGQGDDWSDSIDSDRKAKICDAEDDGRNAYVNYVNGDSSTVWRINDENGAPSPCYVNTNQQPGGIIKHRTCEPITAYPDACSSYHAE
jgi:hypothetical protein